MNDADADDPTATRMAVLAGYGARIDLYRTSRDDELVLIDAAYRARSGEFAPAPRLYMNLCLAGCGSVRQVSDAQRLEAHCEVGLIGLTPAAASGVGAWPSMRVLQIGVAPVRVAAIAAEIGADRQIDVEAAMVRLHHAPVASAALQALRSEAETGDLSSAFCEHLLAVALHSLLTVPREGLGSRTSLALSKAVLGRVRARIEAGLGEDISIAELAGVAGLTRWHFMRAFKASTGMTPYTYVSRRRIDRAENLLRTSSLTVTEIAGSLSYANPSRFAAAFRRYRGISPSEWRRKTL